MQNEPGWISSQVDPFWHRLCRFFILKSQAKRKKAYQVLLQEKQTLGISGEILNPDASELILEGTYGALPEIHVDEGHGAIFPLPLSPPHRFSWYQTLVKISHVYKKMNRLEDRVEKTRNTPQENIVRRFEGIISEWNSINSDYVTVVQELRYLESWIPQLERHYKEEALQNRKPASHLIVDAVFKGDTRLFESLREILKPHRVMKRSFLPDELEEVPTGFISLPIATDISDSKFIKEIEGAIETHWNHSAWAKEQGVRFQIEWKHIPRNKAFSSGKEGLAEHLKRFPSDFAVLTTGGLTTHVKDQALVLGLAKTNPRTLAHEIGHILGFSDCYLRTLTGQAIFGLGVLEWDNPVYPDDLMCDNTVGEPRVEVW